MRLGVSRIDTDMFNWLTRKRSKTWNKDWDGTNPIILSSAPGSVASTDEARALTPFEAALQFYMTFVGSIPCIVYRRTPTGGRERQRDRAEYKILHDRPNKGQTRSHLAKLSIRDYFIEGEYFNLLRWRRDGELYDVTWVSPSEVVKVDSDADMRKTYWLAGEREPVQHEDMIHVVRSPGQDGIRGERMLETCATVLGLHKTVMDAASYYYANAARPSMYGFKEQADSKAAMQAAETFSKGFRQQHQGIQNTGGVPFINWKLEKFPRDSAEDAAILGALQLSTTAVAQLFNLDPFILGDLSGAHYNSLSAEREARVSRSIRPVVEDIELELNDRLFGDEPDVYAQYNLMETLRGSRLEEAKVNEIYIRSGVYLVSEVRERLDLDFIPGTDQPMRPQFQQPTGESANDQGDNAEGDNAN